jgi:hypothetical protein
MPGDVGMPGARPSHEFFVPFVTACRASKLALRSQIKHGMTSVICNRNHFLTEIWSEYGRGYLIYPEA